MYSKIRTDTNLLAVANRGKRSTISNTYTVNIFVLSASTCISTQVIMSTAKIVTSMEKNQNKSHQLMQAHLGKEKKYVFPPYNSRMEDTNISA